MDISNFNLSRLFDIPDVNCDHTGPVIHPTPYPNIRFSTNHVPRQFNTEAFAGTVTSLMMQNVEVITDKKEKLLLLVFIKKAFIQKNDKFESLTSRHLEIGK